MKVSPLTKYQAGRVYKYKTTVLVTNTNCKVCYIPKELYKASLARIKEKKNKGLITGFLIIPYKNYDGAFAIINYLTI